jgi:hypothetical protein
MRHGAVDYKECVGDDLHATRGGGFKTIVE